MDSLFKQSLKNRFFSRIEVKIAEFQAEKKSKITGMIQNYFNGI